MASFSLEFEPVNKVALTLGEVTKLSSLKIQRKTLDEVRDVFLMQCYTGLSYADIKQLSPKTLIGSLEWRILDSYGATKEPRCVRYSAITAGPSNTSTVLTPGSNRRSDIQGIN